MTTNLRDHVVTFEFAQDVNARTIREQQCFLDEQTDEIVELRRQLAEKRAALAHALRDNRRMEREIDRMSRAANRDARRIVTLTREMTKLQDRCAPYECDCGVSVAELEHECPSTDGPDREDGGEPR